MVFTKARDLWRFAAKFEIDNETQCWNWISNKTKNGYGTFHYEGKPKYAHRLSYEYCKSEIPENLVIDHLCCNRKCVNPDHLEIVTVTENIKRGNTGKYLHNGAHKLRKTHCPWGHEYAGENLRIGKKGERLCRECKRKSDAYHYRKRRFYKLDEI